MTCKEIEDLLPGMIDGALPESGEESASRRIWRRARPAAKLLRT